MTEREERRIEELLSDPEYADVIRNAVKLAARPVVMEAVNYGERTECPFCRASGEMSPKNAPPTEMLCPSCEARCTVEATKHGLLRFGWRVSQRKEQMLQKQAWKRTVCLWLVNLYLVFKKYWSILFRPQK